MGMIDPKTEFDFEVIPPGDERVLIKETGVDAQKEGKKTGKRFWARLVVSGGPHDGLSHIEGFYQRKKDGEENEFSLSKLGGFLVKAGSYTKPGKINTDMFFTPQFAEKWMKQMSGKTMGARFSNKPKVDKNGNVTDDLQSEIKKYYSAAEIDKILSGKGLPAATPTTASAASVAATAPATPPADDGAWD
jgi:hypothetical protein